MRLTYLIAAMCIMSACYHPKATVIDVPDAPPPTVETTEKYPKQHPARSRDMVIRNCTVTGESGNKADCICRNATTHIDANDPSKQMMVCK
jgi:hypothetical protein